MSENVSKFKPHPKACKYCGSITRYQADPEGHLKRCAEEQARLLKGLPPTRRRGKRIEVPEL